MAAGFPCWVWNFSLLIQVELVGDYKYILQAGLTSHLSWIGLLDETKKWDGWKGRMINRKQGMPKASTSVEWGCICLYTT